MALTPISKKNGPQTVFYFWVFPDRLISGMSIFDP